MCCRKHYETRRLDPEAARDGFCTVHFVQHVNTQWIDKGENTGFNAWGRGETNQGAANDHPGGERTKTMWRMLTHEARNFKTTTTKND